MKKLLLAAATVALSVAPAAAAHADTTDISTMQNQAYMTANSTDNGTNASVEQYSNKTVSYEALYYVKYDASETSYLNAKLSEWDKTHSHESAYNNTDTDFHTMFGGYGGQGGYGMMGTGHEY